MTKSDKIVTFWIRFVCLACECVLIPTFPRVCDFGPFWCSDLEAFCDKHDEKIRLEKMMKTCYILNPGPSPQWLYSSMARDPLGKWENTNWQARSEVLHLFCKVFVDFGRHAPGGGGSKDQFAIDELH